MSNEFRILYNLFCAPYLLRDYDPGFIECRCPACIGPPQRSQTYREVWHMNDTVHAFYITYFLHGAIMRWDDCSCVLCEHYEWWLT